MPTLENPKSLDSVADKVYKYIYKEYVKAFSKDNHELTRSSKKLYSLVFGQCEEILHAKMKGIYNWKKMDDENDSV